MERINKVFIDKITSRVENFMFNDETFHAINSAWKQQIIEQNRIIIKYQFQYFLDLAVKPESKMAPSERIKNGGIASVLNNTFDDCDDEDDDCDDEDIEEKYDKMLIPLNIVVKSCIEQFFNNKIPFMYSRNSNLYCIDLYDENYCINISENVSDVITIKIDVAKAVYPEDIINNTDSCIINFNPPEGYNTKKKYSEQKREISEKEIAKTNDINITVSLPQQDYNITLYSDSLGNVLETNYNKDVKDNIHRILTQIKENTYLGKMVIIQGQPGTGKSFLVKSLLKEVSNICQPVVVINPVQFFQSNSYFNYTSGSGWRNRYIFVLEDCDKLFDVNVRDILPDAFSALVNITSGIVGAARDDIFLFTFNRELGDIDQAYLRECRCFANMIVGPFNKETAQTFSTANKIEKGIINEGMTLAEAYGELLKIKTLRDEQKCEKKIGF